MTDHYVTVATDAMISSLKQFGDNAINQPAWNKPVTTDMYYGNETGIFKILEGGTFAGTESMGQKLNESLKMTNASITSIYAIAVNTYWQQEQVYIVNTTAATSVTNPTGYDWDDVSIVSFPNKKTVNGFTFDTGESFVVMKHTAGRKPDEEYDPVPGVDQLSTLGFNLTGVVYSSGYSQQKLGFNGTWGTDDAIEVVTSDGPDWRKLFMTLPVCQLALINTQGSRMSPFPGCMEKVRISSSGITRLPC